MLLVIIKSHVPSLYYLLISRAQKHTILYAPMEKLAQFFYLFVRTSTYKVIRLCSTRMFYERALVSFKLAPYDLCLIEYGTDQKKI